jgi:dipeptidyl aminopeptidase/acylaminoacyl peptidase
MRQRYYPVVTEGRPLAISAVKVAELAIKPVAWRTSTDSASEVFYFSPTRGYAEIHARRVSHSGMGRSRTVVKGERNEQFESFHFFSSRLDVSPEGVVAFSSRYYDRDALFLWSAERGEVLGRYQFDGIVSILSPTWAPDGRSAVFSGLSITGYSDLYRVWFPDGRLERLTQDRYEDLDPTFSPDGNVVVFTSDRTPFGPDGGRNLFRLELATGSVTYLTYGPWSDETPRWSRADSLIYFTSDRSGTFQIYAVDSAGTGRRLTNTINGAFDPQWIPEEHGLLFGGFADLSYGVYFARPDVDTSVAPVHLAAERDSVGWTWAELNARQDTVSADPYRKRFSLDFAAGDVAVAPGIGAAQGAVFLFSDMIGDHLLYFGLSSYQSRSANFLENINGTVFYLNQSRRINWGVGAFRVKGTFYELDLTTPYIESSWGGFTQLRYPLSRYQRVEAELRLERSDRQDLYAPETPTGETQRVAWLASNYLSYVKDNTLWLLTGPIDGVRYSITGGLTNDLSHGRFDSWSTWGDLRRYFRTSMRSALAVRLIGYMAGGDRPRRVNLGGTWFLRGYPRYYYVVGTRAWLANLEWRFPLTDFLTVGFPFGSARFPGVQGAMFFDIGRVWTPSTADRGSLGATGFGFRFPLAAPLVLRLDMGWRFRTGDWTRYGLPEQNRTARFVDFFFGFNY